MRKYSSYKVDRHISLRKKSNRETILCLYSKILSLYFICKICNIRLLNVISVFYGENKENHSGGYRNICNTSTWGR